MTVQIGLIALTSLLIGLAAGYALAWVRRTRAARAFEHIDASMEASMESDETRPTLVPFRITRDAGRNLARMNDARAQELDQLMADLDKR